MKKEDFPKYLTTAYHLHREDKRQLYGNHSENITVYLQYRNNDVLRVKVRILEVLKIELTGRNTRELSLNQQSFCAIVEIVNQ